MVVTFSEFTTIFFFLISLIIIGIIFEKQFIALEDKFDAWVSEKKSQRKERKNERTIVSSHCHSSGSQHRGI